MAASSSAGAESQGAVQGCGCASASPPTLYPVEEHAKDQYGGKVSGRMQRVPEGAGGYDHGEHLARRHHDREDDGPEFFDGVEDEELARGRREG